MQQGVNFQNVLENVLKRQNSSSVPGICLALESTKHIDFLNLSGGLQSSISHGINLNVNIDLKLPVNPRR